MTRALLALSLLALAGCSDAPYCGEFVDMTGRRVAFCSNPRQDPLCDLPGEVARFEDGTTGFRLVGGERARCDADGFVVCPLGTTGEPYCVTDPEL